MMLEGCHRRESVPDDLTIFNPDGSLLYTTGYAGLAQPSCYSHTVTLTPSCEGLTYPGDTPCPRSNAVIVPINAPTLQRFTYTVLSTCAGSVWAIEIDCTPNPTSTPAPTTRAPSSTPMPTTRAPSTPPSSTPPPTSTHATSG